MFKRLAFSCIFILFTMPILALAATEPADNNQLIGLYTQLVSLLRIELAIIQTPSQTYLSIYPTTGVAPFFATFIVNNPSGTESINYGDGHTTGSNGCVKNSQGWCDLSKPVGHEYQFPGEYMVTFYKHLSLDQGQILSTSTISVVAPSPGQYNPNL